MSMLKLSSRVGLEERVTLSGPISSTKVGKPIRVVVSVRIGSVQWLVRSRILPRDGKRLRRNSRPLG